MSLFEQFPTHTYQQWVTQVTKELKGQPLDALTTFTRDGLPIKPMYTREDFAGLAPQPWKANPGWALVEEVVVEDETTANQKILACLNAGANGLLLYVFDDVNLENLLKEVLMEHINLHFVVEGDGARVLKNWLDLAKSRGVDLQKLSGTINIDPVEASARQGFWQKSAADDMKTVDDMAQLTQGNIRVFCMNNNLFANAGATAAQQLGIALAHMHEYLLVANTNKGFWLNMAIGSQYFEEIAKFRAIRRLWLFLQEQYTFSPQPLHLYAETGLRNKTIYDPWVNMLRSTTEAMSAALGGADEIMLRSYDSTFHKPQSQGERVARNQQLILAYESYFDRVADPSSGSYFIEELTAQLAAAGWDFFKEIEKNGGLIKSLENGWLQEVIEESHRQEQIKFDNNELPLLGSNLYPNAKERMKFQVKEGAFHQSPAKQTPIRPVVARRLSEDYESKRLEQE